MVDKMVFKNVGQGGLQTSFLIKRTLLKRMLGGGASCQEDLNIEIGSTKQWLQLKTVIQNIQGKGIATMLGKIKSNDVIVKVQLFASAINEYEIQQKLKTNNVKGFIDFQCFATCQGDRKYIESFAYLNDSSRLCQATCVSMGIIIMPYYRRKSLYSYMEDYSGRDKNKIILKVTSDVIGSVFDAYSKTGFAHGDLFAKNILLTDSGPLIIDFEKSTFNQVNKLSRFWRDLGDLLGEIANYGFTRELDEISRKHVTMNHAYGKEPTLEIIQELQKSILYLGRARLRTMTKFQNY